MAKSPQFYCYLWFRDKDSAFPAGTPYYVGKGSGPRAYVIHKGLRPPIDKSHIVVMLRSSEEEAFETEKELINNWGRADTKTGCLRNHTDGGGSVVMASNRNNPRSVEVRSRMSESQKRRFASTGAVNKGKTHSAATRLKMSAAAKNRSLTNEGKVHLSEVGKQGAIARWGRV